MTRKTIAAQDTEPDLPPLKPVRLYTRDEWIKIAMRNRPNATADELEKDWWDFEIQRRKGTA